jgi:hypothetical protein
MILPLCQHQKNPAEIIHNLERIGCLDKVTFFDYHVTIVTYPCHSCELVLKMNWLLFQYELPGTPTKYRVYVWRKLKKLGACSLMDGLYALPATKRSLERFNWLYAEVREMDGHAMLWQAKSLLPQQEERLRTRFDELVQGRYLALKQELTECRRDGTGIKAIEAWSRQWADIRWHDWFEHPLGNETLALINRLRNRLKGEEEN